ncbi:MAG: 7-carboxy-7-deazaguanine synthase QueE [Nautilia sp.]|nr:MAG: 7-carboxy-7-deazaguanine synthase QueE [Nautilia sp.]
MTSNIPISEIFYSIQGEGKYIGRPSLFIRVGGCNLSCPGFSKHGCDSFYAVNKKYKSSWKIMSINDLILEIEKYYPCDIVLTGGEPTLYYKKLYPIIEKFQNITIETNATINIDFKNYPAFKNVAFAMSVKLSNSGEEYKKRVNKEAINNISLNAKKSFFKFVLNSNLKDEIEDITKEINLPIYCMPLGETKEELEKNAPFIFNFCLENGYFYSDRIHIRLFNKKRGV